MPSLINIRIRKCLSKFRKKFTYFDHSLYFIRLYYEACRHQFLVNPTKFVLSLFLLKIMGRNFKIQFIILSTQCDLK